MDPLISRLARRSSDPPDEADELRLVAGRVVIGLLECCRLRGLPLPEVITKLTLVAEFFEKEAANGNR
jgi:hypothetical protein